MTLYRCTCHLARRTVVGAHHHRAQRHASTSLPSAGAGAAAALEEKLVRLARQTLSKAATATAAGAGASDPSTEGHSVNDVEAAKRTKQLEGLRDALREWQETHDLRKSLEDVIANDQDADMREMARADLEDLETAHSAATGHLQSALLPSDPTSALGCLLEIKAGVGGSEASIFAGDLMRMYSRFAAGKKWKSEIVNSSAVSAGSGGSLDAFREVILEVDARGAYTALRHEAGVHRVQRVPATETQGRVHTSTASVIVLPSSSDSNPSLDNVLNEKDVKIEVMRSGGAGGQHVNRTESAVRLTHLPTGITVSMQDTRSQHKNRVKAFQVLRSRLLALQISEQQATSRAERRAQVKGTDRSEKIRTYNFAQDRVTDHRLPLTLNGVQGFLEGDDGSLELMMEELEKWTQRQQIDEMLDDK